MFSIIWRQDEQQDWAGINLKMLKVNPDAAKIKTNMIQIHASPPLGLHRKISSKK